MADAIPKVQQHAIEQITSKTLSSTEYRYLLREAAEKGWTEVVREAIRLGEQRSNLLNRLLHEASKFGRDHEDTVQVLLSAGANPNTANVMRFCGTNSLPLLIKSGGDINDDGKPLLTAITERTKQDKALALIEAGAEVNVADHDGVTALMHAAARGRDKVYNAMVNAGADLYAVDHSGRSLARQIAESLAGGSFFSSESDRKRATKIARELQRMLPTQPEDQILLAIAIGDSKELAKMIDSGLDPNTMIVDGLGLTGFTFDDVVEKCKEYPSFIDAMKAEDLIPTKQEKDEEMGGMTLLMWATATQQADCIRVLLENGADPSLKNQGGISALTLAETRVKYHAITQLLRSGIKSDSKIASTVASRFQMLGFSEPEVEKELFTFQEQFDCKKSEFPSEKRGILIDRHWEIARLEYVLDLAHPCQRSLVSIIEVADELFFGDHFNKPFRDSQAKMPHTAIWKGAIRNWLECFPIALAASSVMGKWDRVDKLLTYPDESCERGDKSPKWNPEWYEWPLWMHLGSLARQEPPRPSWPDEMKQQSTRRSKAVLAAYQSITAGNAKPTQKAIDRIVQAHIVMLKNWSKAVTPSRSVSAEATYFFHLAHRSELDVQFQDSWQPYVMKL